MDGRPHHIQRYPAAGPFAILLVLVLHATALTRAQATQFGHGRGADGPKLLPQCAPCTTHVHCASRKCVHSRCIFETRSSFASCFSDPVLPECAKCFAPGQCKQGVCWGRKCTDGSPESLGRCFLPACARCSSSLECASKLCFAGRCAAPKPTNGGSPPACPDDASSSPNAAPHRLSPDVVLRKHNCKPCGADAECASGLCKAGLCVKTGSKRELFRCRRRECEACGTDATCRSGFCLAGKCVFARDPASRGRCFPERTFRPRCAICSSSVDCAIGVCDGGRCTDGGPSGRAACLTGACGTCKADAECRQGRCWRGRCIQSWRKRMGCFHGGSRKGGECVACVRDRECKAGACVSGKCVLVPEEAEQRCFREECSKCDANEQCVHGKFCRQGRCTSGGKQGRMLCDDGQGNSERKECEPCDNGGQCKSKACWFGKCVFRSFKSMETCFGDASMLAKMK